MLRSRQTNFCWLRMYPWTKSFAVWVKSRLFQRMVFADGSIFNFENVLSLPSWSPTNFFQYSVFSWYFLLFTVSVECLDPLFQLVGNAKNFISRIFIAKSINQIGILSFYFTFVYPWISFSHFCQIMQIYFKGAQVWDFDVLDFNDFFIMKSL